MSDLERLTDVISQTFGHVTVARTEEQSNSALNVIDCVLSLNRRYHAVVVPRLNTFTQKNPNVTELQELLDLIESHSSPVAFGITELNYNHGARMDTLLGVTRYLMEEQEDLIGNTEAERLRSWANSAHPGDYALADVRGFGLAGFQYLRMLFGAQTTKPDVHIIRFVSEAIGRQVNDVRALYLLERAAKKANLPLLELDEAIWKSKSSR